jgi:hypothetical protein
MLELAPGDPIVKAYLKDLQHAVKKRGWTLVAELSTYSGGRRVVPDGTVRDEFRPARRARRDPEKAQGRLPPTQHHL